MTAGDCCLIFGVSGVGKTTACADYVARHPNYIAISASELLKNAKLTTREKLRTAKAEEIRANQRILVESLRVFRDSHPGRPILLDAHAIVDNDLELVCVPTEVIRELQPAILILLEAPPEQVAARRAADSRRRPNRSIIEIKTEIEQERLAVQSYGKSLGLDVRIAVVEKDFRLDRLLVRTDKNYET